MLDGRSAEDVVNSVVAAAVQRGDVGAKRPPFVKGRRLEPAHAKNPLFPAGS
jgi:hypothetical protein